MRPRAILRRLEAAAEELAETGYEEQAHAVDAAALLLRTRLDDDALDETLRDLQHA